MTIPEPAFKIRQPVYHITPDSPKGYVINIRYNFFDKAFEYHVAFSHEFSDWCYEHELILDKQF